ncbi:unnamed protein product [Psylliodes chrysocephalus]|uniref:Uncharacterized protein n=1 Tax=Psylliodes chrysocephalus TaxID=3402493 RepID=A0A9P0GKB2_9CUCU|nr:unnamed protein product [Psylliodes chrysocephala]
MSKISKEPPKKKKAEIVKHQLFSENESDTESDEMDPPLNDESSFELDEQRSLNGFTNKCAIAHVKKRSWFTVNYEGNLFSELVINRTWLDLKSNIKKKVSETKKYESGTGGGPPLSEPEAYDDYEAKIK